MDPLHDAALDAERAARNALAGHATAADVTAALMGLWDRVSAREHRYGSEAVDANGRPWADRLNDLVRQLRLAPNRRTLRTVLRVVIAELAPLTGSERREECFV
jgi:hypothetical protein